MNIRTGRGEGCLLSAETAIEGWALPVSRSDMVYVIAVIRVIEVDFVGGYADDRPFYNKSRQLPSNVQGILSA